MSRIFMFLSCMAVLSLAIGLNGCTPADDAATDAGEGTEAVSDDGDAHDDDDDGHDHDAEDAHDEGDGHDHDADDAHDEGDGHEHAEGDDHASAGSEIEASFASLSEADRAAATAQKICPVSGEALGAMGTPIKMTVKGRDIFICCGGCKGKVEADPDKYLAMLE